MKIYFVRHGETTYNARDVYQPLDSPLSEQGMRQAEFVAKRFSHIPIDIILASPLARTKHTTEIINKSLNKQVEWVDELMEIKRPSEYINKNGEHKTVKTIKKLIKENFNDPNWHFSDEENFFDFKGRAIRFLKLMDQRNEKHILAVTHGEILRMIIGVMLFGENLTVDEFNNLQKFLKTINTGITLCEKGEKRWGLITWNDHAHVR